MKAELLRAKPQQFPQLPRSWGRERGVPYLGPAPSALATSTVAVECLPPVSSSELTNHCPLLDLVLSRLTPFLAFTLQRATVRARPSVLGTPGPPRAPCCRHRGWVFSLQSLLAVGNIIQVGSNRRGAEPTPALLFHRILSLPSPFQQEFGPPTPVLPPRTVTPLWGWASLGQRTGEAGVPCPPCQGLTAGPVATETLVNAL